MKNYITMVTVAGEDIMSNRLAEAVKSGWQLHTALSVPSSDTSPTSFVVFVMEREQQHGLGFAVT